MIYFLLYFPVDLQQTPPLPVCPGDDVTLTCTVTVSTNQSDLPFLYLVNAFDENNRVFHNAEDTVIANSSKVGPFTAKVVEASNEIIVATATIKEITSKDALCAGIKCRDGSGDEIALYVALGKKKSRWCMLISL